MRIRSNDIASLRSPKTDNNNKQKKNKQSINIYKNERMKMIIEKFSFHVNLIGQCYIFFVVIFDNTFSFLNI